MVTGQTALNYAQVVAGTGVVVSNASITGSPDAIGSFTSNGPTGFGIQSGILLSSGDVMDAPGNPATFAGSAMGQPGDPYLENIINGNTNDAVILEFDFVPNADYVSFNFVFGSEEYDEFVCDLLFYDVFALTIEGVSTPLPLTNMALVPGTNLPIGINSINNGSVGLSATGTCSGSNESLAFSQYYNQNTGNSVVYDGFTTVMLAESQVICGETYHLRFMIADGGDSGFDSVVFIEENSLTTGSVVVETATGAGDSTAYEGCNTATVSFTLNGPLLAQDFPVPVWLSSSTATEGADYTPIAGLNLADSTVVIPAGSNSVSIVIDPVNDNITEGPEYIEFVVITSTCGNTDTFRIYIDDLVPISLTTSNDTTICTGNAISWCEASGGGGLYTYTWDNGFGVADTIFPAPAQTTTYHVSVTDNCGSVAAEDSVIVIKDSGPIPFAGNDVSVCIGGSVLLNASSNAPNSTFEWNPAIDLSNPNIFNPLCTPQVDREYIVTVTRQDGCSNDDTVLVTLTPPPTAEFDLPAFGCAGTPLLVHYTGNANAAAQFLWDFDGGVITNGSGIGPLAVNWPQPGTYDVQLVVAWGGCISSTDSSQIEIIGPPPVNAGSDVSFCSGDSAIIGSSPAAGVSYTWIPSSGVADPAASLTIAQPINSTHDVLQLNYVLKAEEQGCDNYDTVQVTLLPLPIAEFQIPDGKCFTMNSFDLEAGGYFGSNATFSWDFGPVGYPASSTQQQPHGVIFNAPGLQPVTLIIEDNSCVSAPFVGMIDVYEMPDAQFVADTLNGCEPLGINFLDQSYNAGSSLYRTWSFGDGGSANGASPSHVYTAGVYTVRLDVVTAQGCADHLTKNGYIESYAKPTALYATEPQIADIIDPTVTFTNLAQGVAASDFTFYPFNQTLSGMEVQFQYPDTGVYSIRQIVTTEYGCKDTISGTVEVDPHYTFYIPNAFTPGNDGLNEVWIPQGESIRSFEMMIYNRWDQELFYSASLDYGWDGTFHGRKVPLGVYIYSITVVDILGEPHKYRGTFSLVR